MRKTIFFIMIFLISTYANALELRKQKLNFESGQESLFIRNELTKSIQVMIYADSKKIQIFPRKIFLKPGERMLVKFRGDFDKKEKVHFISQSEGSGVSLGMTIFAYPKKIKEDR